MLLAAQPGLQAFMQGKAGAWIECPALHAQRIWEEARRASSKRKFLQRMRSKGLVTAGHHEASGKPRT